MSNLRFKEQGTTPADASAGQVQMYAKTDGNLYTKRGGDAEKSISDSSSTVGKVLQVVTGTQSTPTTHAGQNSAYATTDLKADITLSNASNLVLVSFHLHVKDSTYSNNHSHGWPCAIYRTKDGGSAVNIADGGPGTVTSSYSHETALSLIGWSYTDTPAPSNIGTALRYEIFLRNMHDYVGTVTTHAASSTGGASNTTSQITLMEIAG